MASDNVVGTFKIAILIMLFYSFAITLITYSLEGTSANDYLTSFSNDRNADFASIGTEIEGSLTRQTNIPVLDVGSLVFYSGNMIIDLILNFLYAIPEMIGFLVYGIQQLFNLDSRLVTIVEGFAFSVMTALYMIAVVQLLGGIRSGRVL